MKLRKLRISLLLIALLATGSLVLPTFAGGIIVLHLPLNEQVGETTFSDISDYGNHGTCSGGACPTAGASGQIHQALNFDGVDDTVSVSNASTLQNSAFTLSVWFWWDDIGTNQVQFLTAKGFENMEIHTGGGAGVNGLRIIPAGYPETHVDVANFIQSGWNHVAVTYDGNTTRVYRNGTLVGERTGITAGQNLTSDTAPFRLGRRSDGSYHFDGRIDDVRIYNTVLSQTEIQTLLVNVLHMPLDETAGSTTFTDVSGNGNSGTCSGSSCPVAGATGQIQQALDFDGVDDMVNVPNASTLQNATFTLSAWFEWDDVGTDQIQFLTAKGLENLEIHTGSAGVNGLRIIPAGYPETHVDVANFIQPGWNHVAVTYDGSTTRVYRNGTLAGERTGITGGQDLTSDTSPFRLGRRGDGSYIFDGRLDDVQLYNRVLSQAEIQAGLLPASPTGLKATSASVTQVGLQWQDASFNETGFKLERSPDGSTNWTQIGTFAAGATTGADGTVLCGTTYYYRLRAYNDLGDSAYSNIIQATTLTCPASVPAAPSNLSTSNVQATAVTLSWADNSTDETDFQIIRSPNGADGWTQVGIVGANVTTFNDTSLNCATTYYYAVNARNANGQAISNIASVTTGACPASPPAAPSNLNTTSVQRTAMTLTWRDNSADETGFKIMRSLNGSTDWTEIATVGADVASYENSGLTCNTRYSYRVYATSANGDSNPSNVADALTSACAGALSSLDESFDATSLPSGWTLTPATGNTWAFNNPGGRGNDTGGAGNFVIADSDKAGQVAMATELRTPALDLSAHTIVKLIFKTYFRSYSTSVADVDVSVDGGATWTTLWHKTGVDYKGSVTLNVPQAVGKSDVYFRFRYYEANYAWYWQIDDVRVLDALSASAPGAPGNLAAQVSGNDVTLTWQDNSSTEANFIIERSPDGASNWAEAGRVSADTTTFIHKNVTCNSTVYYRVKAINGNLSSGYSNSANITMPVCPVTLASINENFNASTNLPEGWTRSQSTSEWAMWQIKTPKDSTAGYAARAEPGLGAELRTPLFNFSSINAVGLSFDSNLNSDGGRDVKVEISKDGGTTWTNVWRKNAAYTGHEQVNIDLSPYAAQQTNVVIRFSSDLFGTEFWEIDNVVIGALSVPSTPDSVSATLSGLSDVLLAWRSSRNAKYKIERATSGGSWTQIADLTNGATSYIDRNVTSSTTYQYRVRAYNSAGQSAFSSSASVTTQNRSVRYVDVTISLYAEAQITTAADREKYENIIRYFADGVYESSNEANRLRRVTIYRNAQNSGNVNIEWIRSCHPNAHVGGYTRGGGYRVMMCDLFYSQDYLSPEHQQAGGYGALTHEWGHYFYGLYDEYKGWQDSSWIGWPGTNDVSSQYSVMASSDFAAGPDGDLRSLNFSSETPYFSIKTAQGRVFGVSSWTVLARPKSQDPQTSDAGARTYWPELAAVAPAPGELPRIDLTLPGAQAKAREQLEIVWVPAFATRTTHGPEATLATENGVVRQIVIDRAAFMADSGYLDDAKTAVSSLIDQAATGDTLGIIAFDGTATVVQPLTDIVDQTTKDTLIASVDGLTGGTEDTNPGAALQLALDGLTATSVPTTTTRVVYLLTSGSGSTGTFPIALIPDYQDAYIELHIFGFDPLDGDEIDLRQLADLTGGEYTTVLNTSGLQKALDLANQDTEPYQEVMLAYDEWYVGADETLYETVVVDESLSEVEFEVTYFGEPLSATIELYDPLGMVYEVDPDEDCDTWGVGEDAETTCYVAFDEDIQGEWELEVTPEDEELYVMYFVGATAEEGQKTYNATCYTVEDDVVTYPRPIVVQASVSREYPIAGLTATGWVYGPEEDVLDVYFHDDGVAPDQVADDGIYSAYVDYLENGEHWVSVLFDNSEEEAFYTDNGVSVHAAQTLPEITENFERYAEVQVTVQGWQEDDHTDWPDDPEWPATVLTLDNTTIPGRIDFEDDADVFQVTVPNDYTGETLGVRINRLGLDMDPYVYVYAADYSWEFERYLEFMPDSDDALFVPVDVTPGDTFYVEVWHFDEEADTGVYNISAGPYLWSDPQARQDKGTADFSLSAGYTQTTTADTVVTYVHTITNTGTLTDMYRLEALNDQGWNVKLSNADWLSGSLTLQLWLLEVEPQVTRTFTVHVTVPADASGLTGLTTLTATSRLSDTLIANAVDTTLVADSPGLALAPHYKTTAQPGEVLTYTHTLTNTGSTTDTFDLTISTVWGTLLSPTTVTLPQGDTATVNLMITVPTDTPSGTVETTILTATSQLDPAIFDSVTDITTVITPAHRIYLPLVVRGYSG